MTHRTDEGAVLDPKVKLVASFDVYVAQAQRLRDLGFEKLINGKSSDWVGNFLNFTGQRNFSKFPTHLPDDRVPMLIVAGQRVANPVQQMEMIDGTCTLPWYHIDDIRHTAYAKEIIPEKLFYPIFDVRFHKKPSKYSPLDIITTKEDEVLMSCSAEEAIALAIHRPELITEVPIVIAGSWINADIPVLLLSKKDGKPTLWHPFSRFEYDHCRFLTCKVRDGKYLHKLPSVKAISYGCLSLREGIEIAKWEPGFGDGQVVTCNACKYKFGLWNCDRKEVTSEELLERDMQWYTQNYIPCPKCKQRTEC